MPCRVWEARLDWDLASFCMSMLKPQTPFILCSQETAVLPLLLLVHVVKMLLPCLFFSLLPQPSSFLCSGLLACLACAPLPRNLTPAYCLFTSRCVVHAQGLCACLVHVHLCKCACASRTCAVRSVHLPLQKRAVMSLTATRSITASQSHPLVLRPPQLCNNTNQEQRLAQRGEDAGITVRRQTEKEERNVTRKRCSNAL